MTIDVTDESPYQVWGRPLRVAPGARAATMRRRTPVPTATKHEWRLPLLLASL